MRATLSRWLFATGLTGLMIAGVASRASADPGGHWGHHHDHDWDDGPREAPPPAQVEHVGVRAGFVWAPGHWEWKHHHWKWKKGHWEHEHHGKHWREGRWERRGNTWAYVDGGWGGVDVVVRPTAAPPPIRVEHWHHRPGFVWVRGHWDWRGGQWAWVPGHEERERAGMTWRDGRWEMRNGAYVWVDGGWAGTQGVNAGWVGPGVSAGVGVQVGVQPLPPGVWPTTAPPAPRQERWAPRAGFVWVRGHYEWRSNGYAWIPGHYERARAGHMWIDGHWEARAGHWVWISGRWR